MAKVMVVGVKTYSFNDESKNKKIEGAKVSYLTPLASNKQNEIGYLPLQASIPLEMASQLQEVPALYDIKYDFVPGRNNKPEVIVTGFEFSKSVDYLGIFK